MSNIIQIKRGNGKPDGKLAPYELGIQIDDSNKLFVGGTINEDGSYSDAQQIKVENAVNAIKNLGAKIEKISSYELPKDRGKRVFITLKKVKNTPLIYPRIYSKIKKQPL